jgi:hypothetical protein
VSLTQKFIEKGLSSDVRQFLQYQQNKQSPLTSTPGKTHDIRRWKSRSWLREDTTRGGVYYLLQRLGVHVLFINLYDWSISTYFHLQFKSSDFFSVYILCWSTKNENKNYHTFETISKSNSKIKERKK